MAVFVQRRGGGGAVTGKRLSDYEIGDAVYLGVNGVPTAFLVVQHGKPSDIYDDSCDGTWLLMKDCYEQRAWHSSKVNDYENSDIHAYLNGDFLTMLDSNTKAKIKEVKIPYRAGSGTSLSITSGENGLSTRVFLLSTTEVNTVWTSGGVNYVPTTEGASLAYFSNCVNNAADSVRIALLDGSAIGWWLRSPSKHYGTQYGSLIDRDGKCNPQNNVTLALAIRPALVLPGNTIFNAINTIE